MPPAPDTASAGEQTTPAERDHAPNCPAVNPTAHTFVEPPVLVLELPVVAAGIPADFAIQLTGTHTVPSDATTFTPLPRYLSFRVLLI